MSQESQSLRRFIEDNVHRELFGQPVWVWALGAVALAVVARVISYFQSRGDQTQNHYVKVQCDLCGWKGKTSKLRAKCGKCGSNNVSRL